MNNATEYDALLQAAAICFSTHIPVLLWGAPGQGKTACVESAAGQGWLVETVICSHLEPSDFAGLPVVRNDGTVEFAPPGWASRLAAHDGPAIAFLDEFSTAAPSVQAAALRPLTHYQVGALQLPQSVSWGAAANPSDVAAGGWELAAPTASRFVHLDWDTMPIDVYTESIVTNDWPALPVQELPANYDVALVSARADVASYLRARGSQLTSIPKDAASRGRAFPTPRTWDYAARLLAMANTIGAAMEVKRLVVFGAVGGAAGHEFLAWTARQDLPDPEQLLADGASRVFTDMRPDRVFATLAGVLAAVVGTPSAARWTAAIRICAAAAEAGNTDAAVPIVRTLVKPSVRPADATTPREIMVFAGPLALAGLLEAPAA
jgi:hypothetical protein